MAAERRKREGFFSRDSMPEARRAELERAAARGGKKGPEVGLLLARMMEMVAGQPEDMGLMLRGLGVLAAALQSERKEATRVEKGEHLEENLSALLKNLGDQILPPDR